MEENGNFLHLSGVLTDNPVYGHEVFGEKFYYATLSVPRLSGAEDLLPITVSERLMDDTPLTIGSKLALDGQLRSYNKVIEGAGRLPSRASRSIWLTRTATRTRIRCS